MAEKNTANIGFEKQIWDAACVLWGHIPASEYRNVIIGLIFLKYISTAFDKKYQQLVAEGDGFEEDVDEYTSENIFFIDNDAGQTKNAPCRIVRMNCHIDVILIADRHDPLQKILEICKQCIIINILVHLKQFFYLCHPLRNLQYIHQKVQWSVPYPAYHHISRYHP